ncbi:transmembrane protein 94-like isoform X2 [Mercenaria mercenaria]|uniref:transmembrane protein 94-like isoform X2 n=1 Tax=Mercenaria mercenaria TaxID=6596 RepID=UPI00234E64D6|nr:transmembrane protein 94-like isoform X2 [Mercenaria mercenaria]
MEEDVRSYSMSHALELLHEELTLELETYSSGQAHSRNFKRWLSVFHHNVVRTLYHWTTLVLAVLIAVALLVAYSFCETKSSNDSIWIVIQACLILASVLGNVFLALHNDSQERLEFVRLLQEILKRLAACMRYNTWNKTYFPGIDSPLSPCLTLVWTIRDGNIYSIPTPLLVKGDVILLRPGHKAPARCKLLQKIGVGMDAEILEEGEVFSPDADNEVYNMPKVREPTQSQKFMILETPYVKCLRHIFEDTHRPPSIVEHEKYTIMTKWIERKIVPVVLVVMFVANIVRLLHMKGHTGHWTEMVITLQVQAVFPLVPLIIPAMYLLINFYGQARVFTAFEAGKGSKSLGDHSFDTDSSISADEARVDLSWQTVLDWFKCIVTGRVQVITRRINITHILGSVTSLCCVDKKGILSYPNPTPEKIFFLRRGHKDLKHQTSLTTNEGGVVPDTEPAVEKATKYSENTGIMTWVEVLDVTSDPKTSFSVHFDDPSWDQHITSLKPLGLTVLANTCNLETASWYTQFADHVACAGLENEETVAVVNRRCMCALAREIGFSDNAMDIFSLEKTLGMYRQVSAEMTTKERLQRAKSFIQHKIPMPNMVSVVLREKISGSCQLLSQGTADIVLSCCTDFWDGQDLTPLTQTERKKILDFYHRTSIGSYCTAFSYCPVRQSIIGSSKDLYIELPDDTHLINLAGSMASLDRDLELMSECHGPWEFPRSFSADSLIDSMSITSLEENNKGVLQTQCNQVFIGMVTMQYQARQDFIQLIDKLEGACIRFVHFSQENEVRSRVFAEKMGLEAGWNCHISLRSEEQYLSAMSANTSGPDTSQHPSRRSTVSFPKGDKPVLSKLAKKISQQKKQKENRSQSAPSIVNLGASQVKFETQVKTAIVSPRKVKTEAGIDIQAREEVLLLQYEELQVQGHLDVSDIEIDGEDQPAWLSDEDLSRQTSSYITENTEDSLAFDNRAKLPRGIENIRPHLETVDNVPLLVNLFTDCTPETTCEMIRIMQEHGEVVLCVGSSINTQNVPLFLQADCSLALEPLCPQVCVRQPTASLLWDKNVPTPLQLASSLLSIMCPILISKNENISLIHLIAEARSQLMSMRNCFYLMLCCSLSITFAQVLASVLLLPPVLPAQHILWLTLIVVPLLGLIMMGNSVDARVMSLATRKNANHITSEMIVQFILYYLVRFLPPVLVALFCYYFTLHSYCQTVTPDNSTDTCAIHDFFYTSPDASRTWTEKFSGGLVLAQNIFVFLLVLYFEFISLSFVHWNDHIWQQFPATNKLWLIVVPFLLFGQIVFSICDTYIRSSEVSQTLLLSQVHPAVWAVGLAFPIVMVLINELVKHREIKLAVRSQKRARLDFGTKLGMNSPF